MNYFRQWHLAGYIQISLGLAGLMLYPIILVEAWWVPGALVIASGLALLPYLYLALRGSAEEILSDHFIVLVVSFLIYYVAGALLIPFGTQDLRDAGVLYYRVEAPLVMRVTSANCIGLGLALVSGSLVGRTGYARFAGRAIGFGKSIKPACVIIIFFLSGGLSSLYVLQFDSGLQSGVVPGILRSVSMLLIVVIMLTAAYRGRGSTFMLGFAILVTLTQAFGGLLMLSKSNILLPMVGLLVGLVWRHGIRRVILPGLVGLLAVFLVTGPLVNSGRTMFGLVGRVDWSARINVITTALINPNDSMRVVGDYNAWNRFTYTTDQLAAVDLYDSGRGGEDYRLLWWVFIPRFAISEKPIMTTGNKLNEKIKGSDTSSCSPGIFVDGYYNFGWLGLIVVGLSVGWMLAWTSTLAAEVFRVRALMWIPLAMLGSFMAFRMDGNFIPDYWGPFITLNYLVIGGWLLTTPPRKNGANI